MDEAETCSFGGLEMGNKFRLFFMLGGLVLIMLFCVSGAMPINIPEKSVLFKISEPVKMLMIGFGLLGFGSLLKITRTR